MYTNSALVLESDQDFGHKLLQFYFQTVITMQNRMQIIDREVAQLALNSVSSSELVLIEEEADDDDEGEVGSAVVSEKAVVVSVSPEVVVILEVEEQQTVFDPLEDDSVSEPVEDSVSIPVED